MSRAWIDSIVEKEQLRSEHLAGGELGSEEYRPSVTGVERA